MEHVHSCSYVSTAFLPVWAQACNHNVHKAFVESSESRRCVQTPYLDPLTEKVTKKNRIHRIWGPPDTNGSLLDGQLWAAVARWSKTVRCRPSQPPGWPATKNWIVKLDRQIGANEAPNTMIQFPDPISRSNFFEHASAAKCVTKLDRKIGSEIGNVISEG